MWRDLIKDLPDRTSERDLLLLTYAEQDEILVDWFPVEIDELTIWMTRDAIRWKDGKKLVRLGVAAVTQQRIADLLGALLLTPKLADVLARAALDQGGLVGPFTRGALSINTDVESMSTSAMVKHSKRIDKALATDYTGIVCGWKQKCISRDTFTKPGKSTNYGWWLKKGSPSPAPTRPSETDPDLVVIQGPYEAHSSTTFTDYSEFVSLVRRKAVLGGREIDLADAYTGKLNDETTRLVSHEGALPSARRPELSEQDTTGPTHLGERGPRVRAWQQRLIREGYGKLLNPPNTADGNHGPATEKATIAWLKDYGFDREEFIQAKNYTPADRRLDELKWIVLHSTENPIRPGVAKRVAQWFAGKNAPRASAHYIVGCDEIIQCVKLKNVAWAAPGANRSGIQIEQVGQALKTNWLKEGLPVISNSARLVADLCRRTGIPVERLDADAIKEGRKGITTHACINKVFDKSSHIDPGGRDDQRWPWEEFLKMVNR